MEEISRPLSSATRPDAVAPEPIAIVDVCAGVRVVCGVPRGLTFHAGDYCVLEHDRMQEFGRIVRLVEETEGRHSWHPTGMVIRCATLQDQARAKEGAVMSRMAKETVLAKARHYGEAFHIAQVRYSFDRRVLIVTVVSEERRDLGKLAGELAEELHTRVDIRQIGSRDEAALLGGMGVCGRSLCCGTWLRRFAPINIRMAKVQGLALHPGALSGLCNRLKCCLRYEVEQYRELDGFIPREGALVECPAGRGEVIARNVPLQRVRLRLDSGHIVEYDAREIRKVWRDRGPKVLAKPPVKNEETAHEDSHPQWPES